MAGAGSHVKGVDIVEKARHLLAPGGRAFLMFYCDSAAAFRGMGIGAPPLAATADGAGPEGSYDVIQFAKDMG